MEKSSVKYVLILCSILLIVAFVLGRMTQVPGLTMERSLNPLHLISILSTIAIAIIVSLFLNKSQNDNRMAKNLFLNRIARCLELVDHIHQSICENSIKFPKLTSMNKRLNMTWSCIQESLVNGGFECEQDNCKEIKTIIKDLKNLTTSQPLQPSKTAENPISISRNVVTFSDSHIAEIEPVLEKLKNTIFKLEVSINKK